MSGKTRLTGILLFMAWMMGGCREADLGLVDNLNGDVIAVVGHGGMGFQSLSNQLPHNSLTSVVQCIEKYQADGVEVDVQMSRDGVLYMYHSQYLDRMTNCFSCIHDQLAKDLDTCRYRYDLFLNITHREPLAALEAAVSRFSKRNPPPLLFLDLKTFRPCPTDRPYEVFREMMAEAVIGLIGRYQAEDWIMVESKDLVLLQMIARRNSAIRLFYHHNQMPQSIFLAHEHHLYGIVTPQEAITPQQVHQAHELGLRVSLYQVKTRPSMIKAIQKNPDFIQTDNVPLLQQVLDQQ